MKLFEKLEVLNQPEPEVEVIIRDAPTTEGQKWFEEEAERRKQELNQRKD